MITTLNPLDAIKKAAADYIVSFDAFKNIGVIVDDKGDVETQIAVKLQSLGIGIVLECNEGRVEYPAVGSTAVALSPTLTITENVLINRDPANTQASGKTAADLVCELFAIFNPLAASAAGTQLPIILQDFEVVSNTGSLIVYQIKGRANAGWTIQTGDAS
jgi:hypothetical protein